MYIIKPLYRLFSALRGLHFNIITFLFELPAFCKHFFQQKKNKNFSTLFSSLYPIFADKTHTTPLDPTYFYQDTWCASMIFTHKPSHHYDVGSQAHLVGILSQFVPVTMIDIRPITLSLHNLSFVEGTILALPFEDSTIDSLSSICVIEHIGLGRYGDPIDAFGSEKAAQELSRVLSSGGHLYVSVPVDSQNRVYFNAHRAFIRKYVLDMFSGLDCVEEKYLYGTHLVDTYDPLKGFGTGMFHFVKR